MRCLPTLSAMIARLKLDWLVAVHLSLTSMAKKRHSYFSIGEHQLTLTRRQRLYSGKDDVCNESDRWPFQREFEVCVIR